MTAIFVTMTITGEFEAIKIAVISNTEIDKVGHSV